MKYCDLTLQTVTGTDLKVIAISVSGDDKSDIDQWLLDYIDDDNFPDYVEEIYDTLVSEYNVTDIGDYFVYIAKQRNRAISFLLQDTAMFPVALFAQPIIESLLEQEENLPWYLFESKGDCSSSPQNNPLNTYKLGSLSQILSIPVTNGCVFVDYNGNYYLKTTNLLDDFLDSAAICDGMYVKVVVDDIKEVKNKIFSKMHQK